MTAADDLRRLKAIKHIVVLMMENRSFDHMLGYLSLPGGIPGVNGLIPDHGDLHTQLDAWRVQARDAHAAQLAAPALASDGAGHPLVMHEFQQNFAAFAPTMRALGLPAGRP